MNYADIIQKAWEITVKSGKIKWFVFIPELIGIGIFIGEICWQSYLYLEEFDFIEQSFWKNAGIFWDFLLNNNLIGVSILAIFFIIVIVFILPNIIQPTLILSAKQMSQYPEKPLILREKIVDSGKYFFPIFEFHAISKLFSLMSVMFFTATLYRYYHESFFRFIYPIIIGYSIVSLIIWIAFSFTPYFVVHYQMSVSQAIRSSIKLVFLNTSKTISCILVMVMINLRIAINVLLIFGIPFLLVAAATWFANWALTTIVVIVGIFALTLAAYLSSIVSIFSAALWQETFQSIYKTKEED